MSRDTHSISHHQHQTHVDRGVPEALPRKPAVTQPALHPAVEALHHRPQPLVDPLLPLRPLHVDAVLHREHIRRVHPPLQPPPGYDVADLQRVEELEYDLGLELAVRGEELHLKTLSQYPVQEILHELFLVHVQRCLHVTQGEALDVHEEQALISQHESFLASTHPGIRVSEAPPGVVGVSAASGGEVCAVYAGGLDEARGC